ncbi:orotidine-5'-phosphate decarboxylase [Flavobacteriaceae bacterium]|jgi:orotidine-5'-phosphate decarboxylase|nr:orotidine-5'-phosphate decarboxylase [Flavobacteriaceae bacterium]MDB2341023.1 orotidine-5'-phosphate decarboxylase [Flavobacteriaceae bacterium]MDC0874031.1 orotidine-5'-phosphate decarboxylase [Flavobacteriaceae bacterium]
MTKEQLVEQIKKKQSFLCVGLDIDLDKIPPHLKKEDDPIFSFAKAIIDSTHEYAVAYKPNLAFFESYGVKGWQAFQKIMEYLNSNFPDHFTIADAKRGDIGNTAKRYAKAFFETYDTDAVTVAPYMGKDAVEPFLTFEGKHAILLALTSNPGAADFQFTNENNEKLFQKVLRTSLTWDNADRLMYVVGATKAEALTSIRKLVPDSFLLVPGVGAQGGSLEEVARAGMNSQCGLLVNSSRGILYRSQTNDFDKAAAQEAGRLQKEMALYLKDKGII